MNRLAIAVVFLVFNLTAANCAGIALGDACKILTPERAGRNSNGRFRHLEYYKTLLLGESGIPYRTSEAPVEFTPEKFKEWTQSLPHEKYTELIVNGTRYSFHDAPPDYDVQKQFQGLEEAKFMRYLENGGKYLGPTFAPHELTETQIIDKLKKLDRSRYKRFLINQGVFAHYWVEKGAVPVSGGKPISIPDFVNAFSEAEFKKYVINGGDLTNVRRTIPELTPEEYGNYLLRVQTLDGKVKKPETFDERKWVNGLSAKDFGWLLKNQKPTPGELAVILTYLGDQFISKIDHAGNDARIPLGDALITFTMMNVRARTKHLGPDAAKAAMIQLMRERQMKTVEEGGKEVLRPKFEDREPTDKEIEEFTNNLDSQLSRLKDVIDKQPGLSKIAAMRTFIRAERAYFEPGKKEEKTGWRPDLLEPGQEYPQTGPFSTSMNPKEITGFIEKRPGNYIPVMIELQMLLGSRAFFMGGLKELYPNVNRDMQGRIGQFSASEALFYREPDGKTRLVVKKKRLIKPGDTYVFNGERIELSKVDYPNGLVVLEIEEQYRPGR